ncbi:MAG: acyl-CoA desaturase, partial [Micromonosporaceae bacterium]
MTTPTDVAETTGRPAAKPLTEGPVSTGAQAAVWVFVVVPFLALVAAVPVAWGWGLTWIDIAIAVVMYYVSGMGITVGFHRYLT